MNSTLISTLGSVASIIGLIVVISNKDHKNLVRALMVVIAGMSVFTSYLLYENERYTSEQYQQISSQFQKSLIQSSVARDAKELLKTLPSHVNRYEPGENEGIIYSVLRFLEIHKNDYPELYKQFRQNVIADIEKAKNSNEISGDEEILENGAKASIMILSGIAGREED